MKYVEKLTQKSLGDLLIEEGMVTPDQVSEALQEQSNTGYPLADILISLGLLSEWDIAEAICSQLQLPLIFPTSYKIHPEIKELIPTEVLHRHQIVPLDRFDEILTLCVAAVPTKPMLQELKSLTKADLFLYVGLGTDIRHLLDTQFAVENPAAAVADMGDMSGWEQLFDSANESVLNEIEDEPE